MKFPTLIALTLACAIASASDFDSQASLTITANPIVNTFGFAWFAGTPNNFGNVVGTGTHAENSTANAGALFAEGQGTASTDPNVDSVASSNASISEVMRLGNFTNNVIQVQLNYAYSWSVTGNTGAGETAQGEYELAYGGNKLATGQVSIGANDSMNQSNNGAGNWVINLNPGYTNITFSATASGQCTSPMAPAAPEPASFLALGLPVAFLGLRRARRRSTVKG